MMGQEAGIPCFLTWGGRPWGTAALFKELRLPSELESPGVEMRLQWGRWARAFSVGTSSEVRNADPGLKSQLYF